MRRIRRMVRGVGDGVEIRRSKLEEEEDGGERRSGGWREGEEEKEYWNQRRSISTKRWNREEE